MSKALLVFVSHQLVGTWGRAFLAAFSVFSLFDVLPDIAGWKPSMHFVHWVLTENPFYPLQIVAGLYFGWLQGRRLQHRSMLWIWVLPLAILVYAEKVGLGFELPQVLGPQSNVNCATCATNSAEQACTANA